MNEEVLKIEGIFRRSGSDKKQKELMTHLMFQDYSILNEFQNNPHEVANILKQILRESVESAFPADGYTFLIDINENKHHDIEETEWLKM